MAPIPRLRPYDGPALFHYGFRPFFLAGAIYSGAVMLAWLAVLHGELSIPTAFAPRDWHVHEMLFGYVPAVMTGFLLTAVPNWTGRLPIQGGPLAVLVTIWIAGRVAVTFSAAIGWLPAAAIDAAFLLALAVVIAREIVTGRNWRNLKLVGIVSILALSNIAFHLEAAQRGHAEGVTRLAIGTIILLIVLIGGRIVPSFTRNWLARRGAGRLPAPFGRFDQVAVAVSIAALAAWVALPTAPATGAALVVAGALQAARLARWAGDRTLGERLVLILHIGYAFVPIGFLLLGAAAFDLLSGSAGIHAWTAGAVGTMTLAVMTRASLGHTGHDLTASAATQLIYVLVVVAASARIVGALAPSWAGPLLELAALAWAAAFIGFAIGYGPLLCGRRRTPTGVAAAARTRSD
jgi:uncharacterized protein involved in response to NO